MAGYEVVPSQVECSTRNTEELLIILVENYLGFNCYFLWWWLRN